MFYQSAPAKAIGHSDYSNTPLSSHDGVKLMSTESASATPLSAASDVTVETKYTPTHDQDILDGLNKNLDRNSDKPESNKTITAVQEVHQSHFGHCDGQCCSGSIIISVMNLMLFKYSALFAFWIYFLLDKEDKLEKSEVQAIIESTPELDMDLGICRGTR